MSFAYDDFLESGVGEGRGETQDFFRQSSENSLLLPRKPGRRKKTGLIQKGKEQRRRRREGCRNRHQSAKSGELTEEIEKNCLLSRFPRT